MKPFDLEKALAGEPVQTRNGRKVIDFHYFDRTSNLKFIYCDENGDCFWVKDTGTQHSDSESPNDLFMASEPKKVPLTQEDWIKGGPWWVRAKLSRYLKSVIIISYKGIFIGKDSELFFTDIMLGYERTRDGINFEPCYKVE